MSSLHPYLTMYRAGIFVFVTVLTGVAGCSPELTSGSASHAARVLSDRPDEARTGTVEADGARIFYRLYGEGEPLLLLHGFTHTGAVWEPLVPELSRDHLLIVPDLRGHGRSTNPSDRYRRRDAARDMIALLDTLGIGSVAAVGHSSGGRALLHLALMAPERLSAMVLVGSAHRFTDEARADLADFSLEKARKNLPNYTEVVLGWHPGGEEQFGQLTMDIRALASDHEEDHTDDALRQMSVPTLIAHGDRDEVNPAYLALELYELLPNAELWILPNTSHVAFVSHWIYPNEPPCLGCALAAEQFPGVLQTFLDRHRDHNITG